MTLAIWLVEIVAFVVLMQFLLGPVAIYFTNSMQAEPLFLPIEIEYARHQLPPSFYRYLDTLRDMGFYPVAHLYTDQLSKPTKTFLTLLINPTTRDTANVTHIVSQIGVAPATTVHYIEFGTEFADGSEFLTNNAHLPSAFKAVPEKEVNRLRKIKNPLTLYKIHRALLGKHNKPLGVLPPSGYEVQELCRSIKQSMDRQVDTGYFYLEYSTARYRPTIKGAILMTWKLAWPVGAIRVALENYHYDRLIQQLNLDDARSFASF